MFFAIDSETDSGQQYDQTQASILVIPANTSRGGCSQSQTLASRATASMRSGHNYLLGLEPMRKVLSDIVRYGKLVHDSIATE